MPIITVENLVKDFSKRQPVQGRWSTLRSLFAPSIAVRAVDDISFTVDAGEIVGYLGPNGAGKSTTVKMLTGILVPTSGRIEVAGATPSKDRRRNAHNIGVVFGQRTQLWFDLPLRNSLEAIRDLYRVSPADYAARIERFDDVLEIGSFLDTPVRSLSLGERMRGDLVAAMLYKPPVLYLDEPTVGLDVVSKAALREFILETNRTDGTTVMLTTHDMDDVEQLCNRVIVIDEGTVLYEGDLPALKRRFVPHRDLLVTPADASDLDAVTSPLAERVGVSDGVVTLRFDPEKASAPSVISSVTERVEISDLSVVDPDLEDVVRRLYGTRR